MDEIKNVVVTDMANPPSEELNVITGKCIECGNEFTIAPSEQKFYIFHSFNFPKRCFDCRNHKRDVFTFTCVDCGKEYTMDASTLNFYKRNNLIAPKRCTACREIKKQRNENNK